MNRGYVDMHFHLVYGVDDGPRTREESIALLKAAYAEGTRTIVATPHIMPGLREFRERDYWDRLDELKKYCTEQRLDMELLPGAEIYYTERVREYLREDRIPTLADSEYVLVEFDPGVKYRTIREALEAIEGAGYRSVVAHVERYESLIHSARRMEELRDEHGAALQMNAATVLGGKGWRLDRRAKRALEEDLIDIIASDAHNTTTRPPRLHDAYTLLTQEYDEEYASQLTGLEWLDSEWNELEMI